MTARFLDGERHVHIALFTRCDKTEKLVLAYHFAVDNRSALVNYVFEADILPFKPIADMCRALFRPSLFVMAEAEIHVTLRLPPFREQFFRCFEKGNHRTFHILRSASPNESVVYRAAERFVIPALFGSWYDVLVCQKRAWKQRRIFAFETINKAVIVYNGFLSRLVNERISFLKPSVIIVKRLIYALKFADHRHSRDLDCLRKMARYEIFVELSCFVLPCVDFFRPAKKSANNHCCKQHNFSPAYEILIL